MAVEPDGIQSRIRIILHCLTGCNRGDDSLEDFNRLILEAGGEEVFGGVFGGVGKGGDGGVGERGGVLHCNEDLSSGSGGASAVRGPVETD